MAALDGALLFLAALAAGGLNAVVGAGTLITFPTLLALGYPPVVANVSNTVGLVPGAAAATYGFRHTLVGRWAVVGRLAAASTVGGAVGGALLLALPAATFEFAVPGLLVAAGALAAVQPRVAAVVATRRASRARGPDAPHAPVDPTTGSPAPDAPTGSPAPHVPHAPVDPTAGSPAPDAPRAPDDPTTGNPAPNAPGRRPLVLLAVAATGVYGGYFGAAQGVILLALLGVALGGALTDLNGIKNVLAGLANLVSAAVFVAIADVDWAVAAIVAAGATVGGGLGGRYGRRLPSSALRALVVVVAVVAAAWQLVR